MESPSWTAPYRLLVALRLLRVRKINLISIVGVMLGVASIIVVMSVMDGFQGELRSMIRGTLSDLIVEMDPKDDVTYADIKSAVEAVDGVHAVTLQRHTFGLIPVQTRDTDGGRQNYLPVRIIGILPEDEARVSDVMDSMRPSIGQPDDPFQVETEGFLPESVTRAVISEWMSRRLGRGIPYTVGERFVLLTFEEETEDGQSKYVPSSPELVVSRIYSSGNSEYDKLHVYMNLEHELVRSTFFSARDGIINELRVRLDDYGQAEEMRQRIALAMAPFDPEVAGFPEWHIETWEERQRNILRAVNNEKFLLAFVLFFIIVVACFTIFATLTMTVAEKTREIGVLRALGATPGGIMSIFMLNGTLVGVIGSALGYGVGLYVAHNVNPIRSFIRATIGIDIFPSDIYLFDEIPTFIDHEIALWFAASAAVLALLFAIIPSWRAARLRPVEALRYE